MSTIHQLLKIKKRPSRKYKTRVKDLQQCPQKRGICFRLFIMTPRKPCSANRKVAKIKLSTKKFVFGYIAGEGNNLQKFSQVLIRGGLIRDLPGVHYTIIRGKLDFHGIAYRRQGRSKYGTKIWWRAKKRDRAQSRVLIKKKISLDLAKKRYTRFKTRITKMKILCYKLLRSRSKAVKIGFAIDPKHRVIYAKATPFRIFFFKFFLFQFYPRLFINHYLSERVKKKVSLLSVKAKKFYYQKFNRFVYSFLTFQQRRQQRLRFFNMFQKEKELQIKLKGYYESILAIENFQRRHQVKNPVYLKTEIKLIQKKINNLKLQLIKPLLKKFKLKSTVSSQNNKNKPPVVMLLNKKSDNLQKKKYKQEDLDLGT